MCERVILGYLHQVAEAAIQDGFLPDIISSDLHCGSVCGGDTGDGGGGGGKGGAGGRGAQSLINVMAKFLAMGMTLEQVIPE